MDFIHSRSKNQQRIRRRKEVKKKNRVLRRVRSIGWSALASAYGIYSLRPIPIVINTKSGSTTVIGSNWTFWRGWCLLQRPNILSRRSFEAALQSCGFSGDTGYISEDIDTGSIGLRSLWVAPIINRSSTQTNMEKERILGEISTAFLCLFPRRLPDWDIPPRDPSHGRSQCNRKFIRRNY